MHKLTTSFMIIIGIADMKSSVFLQDSLLLVEISTGQQLPRSMRVRDLN